MALGRKTGGRQKGSANKRPAELKAKMRVVVAKIERVIPDAFSGDAHAFLMTVYKDPSHPIDVRMDAAGKAIRYEKPALAAVEMNATIKRDENDLSDAELAVIAGGGGRLLIEAAPSSKKLN